MQKLMLMSILIATVIIPILVSRDARAKRGLRRTVVLIFAFVVLWGYACSHYYYSLAPPTAAPS